MGFFLEPKHYRQLTRILSNEWGGSHTMSAATQLMKDHGMHFTPEEEKYLASLETEDMMINALVERVQQLPNQKPEQFESFFLKLSFIASTTTRLRHALEAGNPTQLEEAFEGADNVGVLQYLMKMAVAEAGAELKNLEYRHSAWLENANARMAPLLTSATSAINLQKDLTQAQAHFQKLKVDSKEIAASVMTTMADREDASRMCRCFPAWAELVQQAKRRREVDQGYQEELDKVHGAMAEFQSKMVANLKSMMEKQAQEAMECLLQQVIAAFAAEVEAGKRTRELQAKEVELEEQVAACAADAASKSKQLMMTMMSGNGEALKCTAFNALKSNVEAAKKEREHEARLAETQARLAELGAKGREKAAAIAASLGSQCEEIVVSNNFRAWKWWVFEGRCELMRQENLEQKASEISECRQRVKVASKILSERRAAREDDALLSFIWTQWKRWFKLERRRRHCREKNERRLKELLGVQGVFRDFSRELESSLDKELPLQPEPKTFFG